jgi:SAM-dependent methyltransferase
MNSNSNSSGADAPRPQDHLNELWWQEHGGQAWFDEVQRRKLTQPHYHQQEAFLQGFFLGLPPVRVLDFGCGFGRHLRNLGRLSWLDVYGCDISAKMIAVARERSGLQNPEDRVRQIEPRGRLPFDDDFFDVVFTSEVLIHVDSAELPEILRELWRVSRSLILHIENTEVHGSCRENDAHDGCWKHDFRAAYSELSGADLRVFPSSVELQAIYLVSKPTSLLGYAPASRVQSALNVARQTLRQSRLQLEDRGLRLSRTQMELEDARREVEALRPRGPSLLRARAAKLKHLLWKREPPLPYRGFAAGGSFPPEEFLAQRPGLISICHPEWRGIRAATRAQSPFVLEIPGIQDESHCRRAVDFIAESGATKVVINGFPPHIDRLAIGLRQRAPRVAVYFVYHGAPAQDHHREDIVIQRMLDLVEGGDAQRLGFVKAGLAECFQSLGYPAHHVTNRFSAPFVEASSAPRQGDRFHIGVFSPDISHKNLVTQVLAALMVPDSIVEVCELPPVDYLRRSRDRILRHGILPHPEFMGVLRTTDASLYVSHSECYPMTVLESLAAGVVCLTSDTSELFSDSEVLHRALVVPQHDNPFAIAKQLRNALDQRLELIPLAQAQLKILDERARVRWRSFVED